MLDEDNFLLSDSLLVRCRYLKFLASNAENSVMHINTANEAWQECRVYSIYATLAILFLAKVEILLRHLLNK
jgi:hypothetical protein